MTEKAIEKAEKFLQTHDNPFHVRTQFFDHKIKTLFTRFDLDHNGKIEKEDFESWAKRLASGGNLDREKTQILTDSVMKVWELYFLPADTNHDGSVEFLELLDHMKSALRGNKDDPVIRQAMFDTLPLIFDSVDTNADGQIAFEEFQAYFESLGINNPKLAIEVFKELDANHDLFLSKDEFVDAGKDFFMGLDSSNPSKLFFGPLI